MVEPSRSCIFCRVIDGSARSSEVHRDERSIAFLDLNPINAGHTLVCPVRHVTSLTDLTPSELQGMVAIAQRVAASQKRLLRDCVGVNLLLSDGEAAGQEVPHAHIHVVPRESGDGFGWRRHGRPADRDALDAVAALLSGR